jgi:hypothetical protein
MERPLAAAVIAFMTLSATSNNDDDQVTFSAFHRLSSLRIYSMFSFTIA